MGYGEIRRGKILESYFSYSIGFIGAVGINPFFFRLSDEATWDEDTIAMVFVVVSEGS